MRLGVLIGLVVGLFVVACTTVPPQSPERRLQIACSSYVSALNALATRNRLGLLSAQSQANVDGAVAIIGPVCEGEIQVDTVSVLAAVETALIVMLEAQGESNGGD